MVSPGCIRPSASAFSIRYFADPRLDRSGWVEELQLHPHAVDPDQRCVADAVQDGRVPRVDGTDRRPGGAIENCHGQLRTRKIVESGPSAGTPSTRSHLVPDPGSSDSVSG